MSFYYAGQLGRKRAEHGAAEGVQRQVVELLIEGALGGAPLQATCEASIAYQPVLLLALQKRFVHHVVGRKSASNDSPVGAGLKKCIQNDI